MLFCVWLLSTFNASGGQVASFPVGNNGWHLGTIAVGNLDNSPELEIIISHRDAAGSWHLDAFHLNGTRLAGFPYSTGAEEMNVSPTLYDLDDDGRDEIIFTRANRVIALRGNGSTLWSSTVDAASYVPTGGFQTVTNGFYWSATGAFRNRLPTGAHFSSQVASPIVANLGGNGNEIVTAWKIDPDPSGNAQDFNPFINDIFGFGEWGTIGESWSGGVVLLDPNTGSQKFVYHLHQLLEAGIAVGNADADPALEVFALNDGDSVVGFDRTRPFGLWGKGMLHKQFGKAQMLMSGSYQVPIDLCAADIDGDGLDEVLVAGTQLSSLWQPNETILDDDGTILWRRWLPHIPVAHAFGWFNSSCLLPINPDADNRIDVLGFNHSYEITFRFWNGVELINHPGWPKNFYPFLPTPPVVGDVDGDGAEEILIGTYHPSLSPSSGSLFVFALDGTLEQTVPVPGGLKHIPALAQARGNGGLDVIYRSLSGQVYVQNFGSSTGGKVSWQTHGGNMRRDGNRGRALFPPGTPLVTKKISGAGKVTFHWTNGTPAQCYRIYRAEQAEGPLNHVATVSAATSAYTDYPCKAGRQYFYEVRAIYGSDSVASAPFAVLALLNNNLVANAGFEEHENSHWDKWFTGNIPMTNMNTAGAEAFQGSRAMRIVLQDQTAGGSIAHFNQYGLPDSALPVTPGALYSFGAWFKTVGMSQPSEHWFAWASSKTAHDTNARPALPWPNYFTPHFVANAGATEWTYVNRAFQLPPGFPNVELGHNFQMKASGSGTLYIDNVFFRQMPDASSPVWRAWVPFGSTWRYATNPPSGTWFTSGFNDSGWPMGVAKFGAGASPTNVVTRLPQLRPTYYFRKTFIAESGDIEELLLSATCTDDSGSALYPIHLFLNGTEVKSSIEVVTSQGNETRFFDLTPFADLIRPGTNLLAVQLNNYWSSWDDVAFDVSLKAVLSNDQKPRLTVQGCGPGGTSIAVETPIGMMWQLQSCDSLYPGIWEPVQTITSSGVPQTILDTGQNGRRPSANVGSRFYRLVPF